LPSNSFVPRLFPARRLRRKKKIPTPISARPATPPTTAPPIAPPDIPLSLLAALVDETAAALEVVDEVEEGAEDEEDVEDPGGEVALDERVAVMAASWTVNNVADGFWELSEENVSFIFS